MARDSKPADLMPRQPIHVIIEPIRHFMHIESASGVVLLAATAVALAAANSPLGETFLGFWQQPFGFRLGGFHLEFSVQQWINDFLMAIFFYVIGLEVKRELVLGELREFRRAVAAARCGARRHDRAGGSLPAAAARGPGRTRLGHPHGDGHRLRGGLPGRAGIPHPREPEDHAAVARHCRRHRRHPGDRHRLHRQRRLGRPGRKRCSLSPSSSV